jgi:hypothetical protein
MRFFRGSVTLLLMFINTLFLAIPLCSAALLRGLTPDRYQSLCTRISMRCAEGWIANNNRIIDAFQTLDISARLPNYETLHQTDPCEETPSERP